MVASLDRVRVTWEGTGTSSPISLGSAISARFAAPTSAIDGVAVTYLIEHQGEGVDEVELGRGVYTHSGTTLARTEIIWSTNGGFGGSAVNFAAGVKHVTLTLSMSDLQGLFIAALQEGTVDGAADYLVFLDTSDTSGGSLGTLKKVKPNNLPGAGGGGAKQAITATPDENGAFALSSASEYPTALIFTAADSTDIEVPDGHGVAHWKVLVGHAGCSVSIVGDPEGQSINGGTDPVPLGHAGATVDIYCEGENVVRVEGETGEASEAANDVDMAGFKIGGNLAGVLASVSGALTKEAHSGRGLVLSGSVTVPNAAGDVGFNCMLYAASGSETITFNSTTSAGLTQDETVSVFVWSESVIVAIGTESGVLAFT